jgi:hypothetical protein
MPAVLPISCSSSERIADESTGAPLDVGLEPELPVDVGLELALAVDVVLELELPVDVGLELELPHAETTRAIRTAASNGKPLCKRITTSSLTSTRPPGS